MKNTSSRAPLLLLCAALLLPASLSGCGPKKNEPVKAKVPNVYHAETLMRFTENYESEDPAHTELSGFRGVGEKLVIYGAEIDSDWNYQEVTYLLDPATGEKQDIIMPEFGTEIESRSSELNFAEDGSCWFTTSSWNWEEDTDTYSMDLFLYHAAPDGSLLARASIYDLLNITDKSAAQVYLNGFSVVGDTLIAGANGDVSGLLILDTALTHAETVPLSDPDDFVTTILPKGDNVMVLYSDSTDGRLYYADFDPATRQLGEPLRSSDAVQNYMYEALPSDSYDFVYSTGLAVYGYDLATDTSTELLNWINSDIDATYTSNTYISPSGIVYTMVQDYDGTSRSTEILKLTKIPDEEVKEKYILTLGTTDLDYSLRRNIIRYNRQSDEYRIVIRDYSSYNSGENNWTGALTQFNNDIVAGNVPDLILLDAEMPVQSYAAKGLFADLYPLLDADPNLSRGDFYQNMLDAFSTDGKLYEIAPHISIQTLIGKSSVVGDNDGWTIGELRSAAQRLGLESDPFNGDLSRMDFLRYICTMTHDQFVDKDTGRCSFDSEEFIGILEYSRQLSENYAKEDIDWDTEGDTYWLQHALAYRNNTAMLAQSYLISYRDFWLAQMGQFGEKISLVGFPNAARNGSGIIPDQEFAVASSSPCQTGAWDFLSYYLRLDLEEDSSALRRFSVLREVNARMREATLAYCENDMNDWDYGGNGVVVFDEAVPAVYNKKPIPVISGAPVAGASGTASAEKTDSLSGRGHWYYYLGNITLDMGMMTEEAADHVDEFLSTVNQLYRVDTTMMGIIEEEASAFFAGQKSAQEAAKLIQSRVSLYISENR